jgi:hypothetical protein
MQRRILAIAILAAFAAPVLADGIPVEPGLWSITTTVNMPMLPAPQTVTVEECMTDEIMDMEDMSTDDLDSECDYALDTLDGNTMAWSIDCPVEGGGQMHAEWQATSSGDTVDGEGKMTMTMQGQTMDMTMSWTGKRVGPCN